MDGTRGNLEIEVLVEKVCDFAVGVSLPPERTDYLGVGLKFGSRLAYRERPAIPMQYCRPCWFLQLFYFK